MFSIKFLPAGLLTTHSLLVSWKLEVYNQYHRKRASLYLKVVLIYEMECLNKAVENRSSLDLDSERCR